jgi:hypothetical protein
LIYYQRIILSIEEEYIQLRCDWEMTKNINGSNGIH